MSKRGKVVVGVILIVIGLFLIITGFLKISGEVTNLGSGSVSSIGLSMIMIILGFILAAVGGVITYLANMKKLLEYSAKQSEKMAESVGRGLSKGMKK